MVKYIYSFQSLKKNNEIKINTTIQTRHQVQDAETHALTFSTVSAKDEESLLPGKQGWGSLGPCEWLVGECSIESD